jgi:carbon storage regulator
VWDYGLDAENQSHLGVWTEASAKESTMLVLSRKKNESIIINDDITIVVVEIRGDKVRLGVEAPKEVPVHRNEVYEAIRRNQQKTDGAETSFERDATRAAE